MGVLKKTPFFIGIILLIISVLISFKLYNDNRSLSKQLDNQTKLYSELKDLNQGTVDENSKMQTQIKDLQDKVKSLETDNEKYNQKSTKQSTKSVSKNSNSTTDKTVYLTFDDGPSPNTPKILDILKTDNINATFFVIGNQTDFGKSMMKRIVDEGNAIGNHTYSHDYKTVYSSINAYINDTNKEADFIYQATGVRPEIIRFPGGSNNHVSWQYSGKGFMGELTKRMVSEGYQYFDWNVSATDAEAVTQDKNKIINSVLSEVKGKNNAIVLFHDSKPKTTTVEALPEIISTLKQEGYKFGILTKDSYTVHFE